MRMLFKSLLAIAMATFSVVSLAGSPAPAAPPAPTRNGVYVDIAAGYASIDWSGFGIGSFNGYNAFDGQVNSNAHGSFTFGFDVGYQINNILAIEAAWYRLPEVKGQSDIVQPLPDLKLKSWLAYLALKFIVPLNQRFSVFGKAGLGYRSQDWDGNATGVFGFGDHDTNYFSGVFGAGVQYYFNNNLSVSAQYLYMLDKTNGNVSERVPSANLIVGTVSYIFPVV